MSKFDAEIKGDSTLYSRYMDDVLRDIKSHQIDNKLIEINRLNPSLKFTVGRETDSSIPFLDMEIHRRNGKLTSEWFTKPTDTGLTMNFHALAPMRYKRSVVSGLVHRIHHSCSTWKLFHNSLQKAKKILENNQYPKTFYEPIISRTITRIIENHKKPSENAEKEEENNEDLKMICVVYRGKVSEKFEQSLRKINAPCKVVFTLKKLKTYLPSLKPVIDKSKRCTK